jgi:hypothetical protein
MDFFPKNGWIEIVPSASAPQDVMSVGFDNLKCFWAISLLRTGGDFCHQGRDTEIAKKQNQIVETCWHGFAKQGIKKYSPDGTIVFRFNHFREKNAFSEISGLMELNLPVLLIICKSSLLTPKDCWWFFCQWPWKLPKHWI